MEIDECESGSSLTSLSEWVDSREHTPTTDTGGQDPRALPENWNTLRDFMDVALKLDLQEVYCSFPFCFNY